MNKQPHIWTKLELSAVFALAFGLTSWFQYSKYSDGRGLARWLIPPDASPLVLVVIFIALPLAGALAMGWAVAKE